MSLGPLKFLLNHPSVVSSVDKSVDTLVRGAFVMGTNSPPPYPGDGEGPPRLVVVSDFLIDEAEVEKKRGLDHRQRAEVKNRVG